MDALDRRLRKSSNLWIERQATIHVARPPSLGVARHRLPGTIHTQIQQLIENSKLKLLPSYYSWRVWRKWFAYFKNPKEKRTTGRKVACCKSYQLYRTTDRHYEIQFTFFQNLIKRELILADDMRLGIHANVEGSIIQKTEDLPDNFFTLGSLLKGRLWESTAVPELRNQAKQLAELLIRKINFYNFRGALYLCCTISLMLLLDSELFSCTK